MHTIVNTVLKHKLGYIRGWLIMKIKHYEPQIQLNLSAHEVYRTLLKDPIPLIDKNA
jgi:hypothetical protein